MFFVFIGVWEFIQSEYTAKIITKYLTEYTRVELNTDLAFERLRFNLYPPGAYVENVEIKSLDKKNDFSASLKELGVSFEFLDMFQTRFTLSNIYMTDGRLNINRISRSKKISSKRNITDENIEVSFLLKKIEDELPVRLRKITLNQIHSNILGNRVTTKDAQVSVGKNQIDVNLNLESFKLKKMEVGSELIDNFEVYASITDEKINLYKLQINKDLNEIVLDGTITKFDNIEKMNFDVSGTFKGHIDDLSSYIDLQHVGKLEYGIGKIDFKVKKESEQYKGSGELTLQNIKTDFFVAESIYSKLSFDTKDVLKVDLLEFKNRNEKLIISKPVSVYSFEKDVVLPERIFAKIEKVELDNALRIIKDTMSVLTAKLSGNVEFYKNNENYIIEINHPIDIFDLSLDIEKRKILGTDKLILKRGKVSISKKKVDLDLDIKGEKIAGEIFGEISKNKVVFNSKKIKIDLEEIGPFAGLDIKGIGELDINAVVRDNIAKLDIKNDLSRFSFEGYSLEHLDSNISFDFKKNRIYFENLNGIMGESTLSGEGVISLEDLSIASNIKHNTLYWNDLKKIYYPLLGSLDFIPESTFGNWKTNYKISGKATLEEIVVNGQFSGINNIIFDEGFDKIDFKYSFKNKELGFLDIKAQKSKGRLFAGYKYNLDKEEHLVWGNIVKIPLREITHYKSLPLNLNGTLNGIVKGRFNKNNKDGKVELNLTDTKIAGESESNSYVQAKWKDEIVSLDGNFLGRKLEVSSDLNLKNKNKNRLAVNLDLPDINELLNILTFVDAGDKKIEGNISLKAESQLNLEELNKSNFNVNIKEVNIKKDKVELSYKNSTPEIIIENGKLHRWDLKLFGKKIYFLSQGKGDLINRLDIESKAKIDASLLEVFDKLILNSSGTLLGAIKNSFQKNEHKYSAKLISSDLLLSSALTPFTFTKGNMLLTYKNKKFNLKRFKAALNSGSFSLKGLVNIDRIIPEIDMTYEFRDAGVNVLKRSELVFSGKGKVFGSAFPYTLNGNLDIQQLTVQNEFTDFISGGEIGQKDISFLPANVKRAQDQYLNLDIDITTQEPIKIVNSMANIGFVGAVKVTGGENDPRLNGKLELAPQTNQAYFKNNIFNLNKGNIYFYRKNSIANPELDFEATSLINDYALKIRVFDFVDDFKLDLASDPSLVKSDILSLIAFGYTEDLSSNLSESEKESMTQAGVGSILFDRFKINETLKSEFGLEVNLGTEITEEERSYLTYREGESSVGRVRSATKLEIKKQINEEVDLSVSSTVGSSSSQKQTMNLNYNIDNGVSLEGVYENRTDSKGDGNIDDTSFGADLKWKWPFK